MVEPEIAFNKAGRAEGAISGEELAARLGAPMLDFVDYRGDLERLDHLSIRSSRSPAIGALVMVLREVVLDHRGAITAIILERAVDRSEMIATH